LTATFQKARLSFIDSFGFSAIGIHFSREIIDIDYTPNIDNTDGNDVGIEVCPPLLAVRKRQRQNYNAK